MEPWSFHRDRAPARWPAQGRAEACAIRFHPIFERLFRGWLAAVGIKRWAAAIVLAALALTAVSGWYAAATLRINTDTAEMIAPDVPFRRQYEAFKRAFPQLVDTVLVVIDGDTPGRTEDAAQRLTGLLRGETGLFRSVDYPAGEPFFKKNGLLYLSPEELSRLSERLAQAQPFLTRLNADPSLRGFFAVVGEATRAAAAGESTPGLAEMYGRVAEVVESVANGQPARLDWRAMLSGGDGASGSRRAVIVVQPKLDFSSLNPAGTALETIRERAVEAGLTPENGIRVRLTGSAAMNQDELESVREGIGLSGLLSLVVVTGLLLWGLRSVKLAVATVATLLIGLVWTAGFAAILVGHLNLMSVAFAVLFIGLGVDFGIHFVLRYREARAGVGHREALAAAGRGTGPALTLCAVAAAIGFYSFVPTSYAGLSELGLIAGTGMFVALLASLTVLPALLSLLAPRPAMRANSTTDSSVGDAIRRWHRPIIALTGIAIAATLIVIPQVTFDFNPLNLRDPMRESVATFLDLADDPVTTPYRIALLAPSLKAAVETGARLKKLDTVRDAVTLQSFVPDNQDEKLRLIDGMAVFLAPLLIPTVAEKGPSPAQQQAVLSQFRADLARLIDSQPAPPLLEAAKRLASRLDRFAARFGGAPPALSALETALIAGLPQQLDDLKTALEADRVDVSNLPESLRRRMTAVGGRALVELVPAVDVRRNDELRRFVREVTAAAPTATGGPVVIVEAATEVLKAFRKAAIIALVAVSALLLVLLRRLREVTLVLLPLFVAALLTGASTVLFGMAFNFANVIVLPLLFGIGVAGAVHLVLRRRGDGSDALLGTSTPRAVLFSALTTLASFGSLAISNHPGTASMGILLSISILLTLYSTLVFLPALMVVGERRE